MKNLFLLSLLAIGLFTSCKDREPDPNVLPQATQSGKNTAGALVNGKVWVASKNYHSETFAEVNSSNYTLITIYLKNVSNNSRISIKVSIKDFELNKTYEIIPINPNSDYNYMIYINDESNYSTQSNSEYIGKIKITKLNLLQDQIVSGTFEFKALDNNGNVVNITDGRFDKKFFQ